MKEHFKCIGLAYGVQIILRPCPFPCKFVPEL